jgi:hypothetical protein
MRIEKTVFVSYRRADESLGLAIFQNLTRHGCDVFIDYGQGQSLPRVARVVPDSADLGHGR